MHHFEDFSHYHFHGQRDGERIMSVIHRHWFDITMHYTVIAIVLLIIVAALFVAQNLGEFLGVGNIMPIAFFVASSLVILLWFYGFLLWIDYWLDVWIVTDQRVVNIEQKGLFSRHVSELHFHMVQDVTSKVQGVIPTLLNYGDVEVQTAAEKTRFLFRRVPDPYAIKAMLVKRQREAYEETLNN